MLLTFALYVGAAVAARSLARRYTRNAPIATYLTVAVAVDALRWGRVWLLPPATGPRHGLELLLRHLEQGMFLVAILALPVLAVVLFARWSPAPVVGLGGLLWAWIVWAYPELRGADLLRLYAATELAGVVLSAGAVGSWLLSGRAEREGLSAPAVSGLALLAGGAVSAGASLQGAPWAAVVAVNAATVGWVLLVQLIPRGIEVRP